MSGSYFGKQQSVMLGGIAILLMIWHHLFNAPTWYSEGVGIDVRFGMLGNALVYIPAATGNICVQMFAIISGYALFINPNAYGSWRSRGMRLLKFMAAYWMIFALFLLVAWFNDDSLPSWVQFIHNMVGLETKPEAAGVNVPFAWYVSFYIQFVILIPLLMWVFEKGNIYQDILGMFFLCALVYFLRQFPYDGTLKQFFSNIHPILCVGLGILGAKYNVFEKLHTAVLKRIPSLIILVFIALDLYAKYKLPQFNRMGGQIGATL